MLDRYYLAYVKAASSDSGLVAFLDGNIEDITASEFAAVVK